MDERAEQLKALRRKVAEGPQATFRDLLLRVLDEMVWEAHKETADSENSDL